MSAEGRLRVHVIAACRAEGAESGTTKHGKTLFGSFPAPRWSDTTLRERVPQKGSPTRVMHTLVKAGFFGSLRNRLLAGRPSAAMLRVAARTALPLLGWLTLASVAAAQQPP